MPPFEKLVAFFAATAVFAYVPGPAMLYAAARTLAGGRRAGLLAALGIHFGGYAHVVTAAAGLSVLFHAVPPLYLVVKLCGAAYLVWLGIGMLRRGDGRMNSSGPEAASARPAFAQSVVVEVLNPKTALFFLAFLPQFADPAAALPVGVQLLLLGSVVNLVFSAADVVYVLLAGVLVDRFARSPRAMRLARRVGGCVLLGLGAHLALQRG